MRYCFSTQRFQTHKTIAKVEIKFAKTQQTATKKAGCCNNSVALANKKIE
jgi:hypothetical protein